MATHTRGTRPIPNRPETVPGGATYYEATRNGNEGQNPRLRTVVGTNDGDALLRLAPRPIKVSGVNLSDSIVNQGVITELRLVVDPTENSQVGDTNGYLGTENDRVNVHSRTNLVLTATGFHGLPWLNGLTLICNYSRFHGGLFVRGIRIDQDSTRGRQIAAAAEPGATVTGELGVAFARVLFGDPQGLASLEWTKPTDANGNDVDVDYYNVYQRKGNIWGLMGSTTEPRITLDNVVADTDLGLPVHQVPLDLGLRSRAVDDSLASRGFTLGTDANSLQTLPQIPDTGYSPFPQCSAFFAQRQVYAGSRREPETFHMSRTAQFRNFGYSQPRQDDDAIERQIASGIAQEIRHMVPLADLLVFTSRGEYRIGAQGNGAVTPNSITASPQSFHGASHVPPVRARDKIIVVERGGKRINDFRFEFEADTYTGQELTVLATHLFDNNRIVDMAYHEGNTPLLFVITDRGKCLVQTKDEALELSGWTEWQTQGKFRSVSVLRTANNTSAVFFVIERRKPDERTEDNRIIPGATYFTTERVEFDAVEERTAWTDSGKVVSERLGRARLSKDSRNLFLRSPDFPEASEAFVGSKVYLTGILEAPGAVPNQDVPELDDDTDPEPGKVYVSARSDLETQEMTVYSRNARNGDLLLSFDGVSPVPASLMANIIPGDVEVWAAQTLVTGLDHLTGETVVLGGDGHLMGYATVDENGVARPDEDKQVTARELTAGLEYRATMKTLPISTFDQNEPKFYASTRRITRVAVDTQGLGGGEVAQGGRNLPRADDFKEIPLGDETSLKPVPMSGPFTYDQALTFTHADPTDFKIRRFSAWVEIGK